MTPCPECDGKRAVEGPIIYSYGPNPTRVRCPHCRCEWCNGYGEVMRYDDAGKKDWMPCRPCNGTGVDPEFHNAAVV